MSEKITATAKEKFQAMAKELFLKLKRMLKGLSGTVPEKPIEEQGDPSAARVDQIQPRIMGPEEAALLRQLDKEAAKMDVNRRYGGRAQSAKDDEDYT